MVFRPVPPTEMMVIDAEEAAGDDVVGEEVDGRFNEGEEVD